MLKRILINREDREIRVAFLEDEELVELHIEQADQKSIVGNIYKGVVQDVKPGLQAAFVDCGLERNVFLHFMDIRAESLVLGEEDWRGAMREAARTGIPGFIQRPGRRPKPDPRNPGAAPPPVEKGDELIVQILKDEIGTKAPRGSTNLSIPGRYLVLLPFPSQQGGVSRKIAMGEDRYRLKKLLSRLRDDETSFIVRTAGTEQEEEVIRADVDSLRQLWQRIVERYRSLPGPGLVFSEHEILGRLVRDAFSEDTDEIWCDDEADVAEVRTRLQESIPDLADRVYHYNEPEPILERFGAEKQIQRAMGRKVWLKSGGFIVIDENEALTAIDVNSGRFTGGKDQERTSLKINLEACRTIAQQIRLRDIGGIIVIDFIDMLSHQNQQAVEEALRAALRADRTKISIGRIGDFGLMQLTRKRRKESLRNTVFDECPYCAGSGRILAKNEMLRRIRHDIRSVFTSGRVCKGVVITANPTLAHALRHEFNDVLQHWQDHWQIGIEVRSDLDCHFEDYIITPTVKPVTRLHRIEAPRREALVQEPVDSLELVPGPIAPYELGDEWTEEAAPELAPTRARSGEGAPAWAPSGQTSFPNRPTFTRNLPPRPAAAQDESGPLTPDSIPLRFGSVPTEALPPPAAEGQGEGGNGGRRRRRRRRGRGGRAFEDTPTPMPAGPPAAGGPAVGAIPAAFDEEDFGEDEEMVAEAPAAPGTGEDPLRPRRTRRGSRGGRRRRRREEDFAFSEGTVPIEFAGPPAPGQPLASVEAAPADLLATPPGAPVRMPRPPRPPRVNQPMAGGAPLVVADPTLPLAPTVHAPVVAVAPAPPVAHPVLASAPAPPAAASPTAWPHSSLAVIDLTGRKAPAGAPTPAPKPSPMQVFAANLPPATAAGDAASTGPVTRLVLGKASAEAPKPKPAMPPAATPAPILPPSTGGVPILDLTGKTPRPPRPPRMEAAQTAPTILAAEAPPETETAPSEVSAVVVDPTVPAPEPVTAEPLAALPVAQPDLFIAEPVQEPGPAEEPKPKARRTRKKAEAPEATEAPAEPAATRTRRPKAPSRTKAAAEPEAPVEEPAKPARTTRRRAAAPAEGEAATPTTRTRKPRAPKATTAAATPKTVATRTAASATKSAAAKPKTKAPATKAAAKTTAKTTTTRSKKK